MTRKPESQVENANKDAHSTEVTREVFITFLHSSRDFLIFTDSGLWQSRVKFDRFGHWFECVEDTIRFNTSNDHSVLADTGTAKPKWGGESVDRLYPE